MNKSDHPFNLIIRLSVVLLALIVTACGGDRMTREAAPSLPNSGYLLDSSGTVVKSSDGSCWRTGYWTAEMATEECDPSLVKKVSSAAERTVASAPIKIEYCTTLDIQYEIDQDAIQREYENNVARLGSYMKKYPDTTAVIEGHTDEVGTEQHNMKLSQRRADNVVAYLVEKSGIDRSRLQAVGYGDTRPMADNQTEDGKRMNRRIDAVVDCVLDTQEGFRPYPGRITLTALDIQFDKQRTDVKRQYHEQLASVADFMKQNKTATVTVEGHTSNEVGTVAERLKLSQQRAQNVVNYLVDKFGIERNRLTAVGFGQARRVAYNDTKAGERENRRVNLTIDYVSKAKGL
ncbi:MAG: OmpA family protein [Gallionellaceae bacterium]|nr:OmpA family protein [Gallionellaceae bacterium]